MTATEYFELSLRLGNALKAANELGISIRQHYYYVDGHTPVPASIAKLLGLLVAKKTRHKIARDVVASIIAGMLIGGLAGAWTKPRAHEHWHYSNCDGIVRSCAIG